MSESNETSAGHIQRLSDEAYTITGVYLTIIGTVAISGNLFVLYVLWRGRPNFIKIHLVMTYIIAISDLMVASVAFPLTAISGYYKKWVFDDFTCILGGFIVYFFSMCTMSAFCVVSITRYIIICNPSYDRYIRGNFYIVMWSVGVVAYALFWTGTPLIGWSSYGPEPFETSCTLNWYGETWADKSYNALCIVFCYVVPLGVLVWCYYHVIKTSLSRCKRVFTERGPDMDTVVEEMSRRIKIRSSRHMTCICLSMVITFFITWTPYTVITAWNLLTKPVSSEVQVLPTMFAKLNCTINPIIFAGFCERFRESMYKAWPCRIRVRNLKLTSRPETDARVVRERDITLVTLEEPTSNRDRTGKRKSVDYNIFMRKEMPTSQPSRIGPPTTSAKETPDHTIFTVLPKTDNCECDDEIHVTFSAL